MIISRNESTAEAIMLMELVRIPTTILTIISVKDTAMDKTAVRSFLSLK